MRNCMILAVCLVWSGVSLAGPLDDATAAYESQDYATALRLWQPLAAQGLATTQYDLGFMYSQGKGVPQDYAEAVKLYRKAAEQGLASAQGSLGTMYFNGTGVPQDYVQAHKWFNLAGADGSGDVGARGVKAREEVAAKMTPAQIAEAKKLAREWKATKPDSGN
jgi:uncharacterized protein